MKLKKIFATVIGAMCFLMPVSINAEEAEIIDNTTETMEMVIPYTAGLIMDGDLSCTGGNKKVYINADITATREMYKLGFKNIYVQRSSTGSNWATEVSLGDDVVKNEEIYSIDNLAVDVQGGYYYRVKCTFYAQEHFLIGPTQTFEAYSYYTYIA